MGVRISSGDSAEAQLVKPQPASQEYDTKDTDKKDQGTSRHLIDRDGGIQEPDVHQLSTRHDQRVKANSRIFDDVRWYQ